MESSGRQSVRTYILDTNVLIHNPEALTGFDEHNVILPMEVIEELDGLKRGSGEVSHSARQALRIIDSFRNPQKPGEISKGMRMGNGGMLRVLGGTEDVFFPDKTSDNRIISAAVKIKNDTPGDETILVSKDTAVRIKAEIHGVVAEDYRKDKSSVFEHYGKISENGDERGNGIRSVRYRFRDDKTLVRISGGTETPVIINSRELGLWPKNKEQRAAMDALLNPESEIVALTGAAGAGKTLLALAAGIYLVQSRTNGTGMEQVLVTRPVIPIGNQDLGFLPGEVDEKMAPWAQPIHDNLDVLVSTPKDGGMSKGANKKIRSAEYLIEDGTVKIVPMAHIRGRSLPRRFFIVDEAQNLRPLDIKTLITRCGEGTKIIFTGDLGQIDAPYLDSHSSGLAYLIDRYINEPEFCYLNFQASARSPMADKASRLL